MGECEPYHEKRYSIYVLLVPNEYGLVHFLLLLFLLFDAKIDTCFTGVAGEIDGFNQQGVITRCHSPGYRKGWLRLPNHLTLVNIEYHSF